MWVRSVALFSLVALLFAAFSGPAGAHPMGNFSINHYSKIELHKTGISVRYIIDMAEIPTVTLREAAGFSSSGATTDQGRFSCLLKQVQELEIGLKFRLNGSLVPVRLTPLALTFSAGAGGLPTTRIETVFYIPLSAAQVGEGAAVDYVDNNYPARTGWKEMRLVSDAGMVADHSDVSLNDLSQELKSYPADPTLAPPACTAAHFIVRTGSPSAGTIASQPTQAQNNAKTKPTGPATPRDAFTQSILGDKLTGGAALLALLIAIGFGALHALSPGHGKAMMAAYLVGARGTARHAVLLGVVVTITHTAGVFIMGVCLLYAAKYVVPERLFPVLSGLSGVTIAIMGAVLLRSRSRSGINSPGFGALSNSNANAYNQVPLASPGEPSARTVQKGDPLSPRSLIALGITGGILPCPSALVVMLSAVAMHRVAFGLLLIVAFSLGLAVVLTTIGISVVYMRSLTERVSLPNSLLHRIPILSAAFVTVLGLVLVYNSFR